MLDKCIPAFFLKLMPNQQESMWMVHANQVRYISIRQKISGKDDLFARVNRKQQNRVIVKCRFANRCQFEVLSDLQSRDLGPKPMTRINEIGNESLNILVDSPICFCQFDGCIFCCQSRRCERRERTKKTVC